MVQEKNHRACRCVNNLPKLKVRRNKGMKKKFKDCGKMIQKEHMHNGNAKWKRMKERSYI